MTEVRMKRTAQSSAMAPYSSSGRTWLATAK
jgi:hypothetical protein